MKPLILTVMAVTAVVTAAAALARPLAIVGATVIDGNGGPPIERGVVLIEADRITAVGDRHLNVPANAKRVDASGKYVIPGLMDANVHLLLDFSPYTLSRFEGRYDELIVEAAQVALRAGVTTVFDSWGPRVDLVKARDEIAAGRQLGARIYLAGNIVGFGGPYSNDFTPDVARVLFDAFTQRVNERWQDNVGPELLWMSPEAVRDEIRKYLSKGVDFLKYAVNGHNLHEMQFIAFSARTQRVIVEEARRAGITVQTHTTSDEGIEMALAAGVDLMQHCNSTGSPTPTPLELIRRIAESRIPCALLVDTEPVVAWYHGAGPRHPLSGLHLIGDANARALIDAGAVVLLSTDAGVFSADQTNSAAWKQSQPPDGSLMILGEGHFQWLAAVEQKGMKPMDALMAATRNIARAYQVDQDLGTLEAGKLADLVVLDADPLRSAANYRSIHLVMKQGRVIDRQSLPTRRFLTQPQS